MKKIIILGMALLLCGCGNPSSETVAIQTSTQINDKPSMTSSNVESKMDSTAESEIFDMPNTESLSKEIINLLQTLNAKGTYEIEYDSYIPAENGDIDVELLVSTDLCTLRFTCIYMKDLNTWAVLFVSNDDNEHYYYAAPGGEDLVDLYNYETDTLIKEKSANPKTSDKLMEDYKKDLENIDASFNDSLSSIADEYNVYDK